MNTSSPSGHIKIQRYLIYNHRITDIFLLDFDLFDQSINLLIISAVPLSIILKQESNAANWRNGTTNSLKLWWWNKGHWSQVSCVCVCLLRVKLVITHWCPFAVHWCKENNFLTNQTVGQSSCRNTVSIAEFVHQMALTSLLFDCKMFCSVLVTSLLWPDLRLLLKYICLYHGFILVIICFIFWILIFHSNSCFFIDWLIFLKDEFGWLFFNHTSCFEISHNVVGSWGLPDNWEIWMHFPKAGMD